MFRTYGDYYYTLCGFLLTLLSTILAALKTVVTNILQAPQSSRPHKKVGSWEKEKASPYSTCIPPHSQIWVPKGQDPTTKMKLIPRLYLTPIQLLHLLSPLALFQCILLAIYFGETDQVLLYFRRFTYGPTPSMMSGNQTFFSQRGIRSGIDKMAFCFFKVFLLKFVLPKLG